jgi:sec-independent protein translocase protein TatB
MEILGIGPGEFIFILVILLVVVGPERLPDLARQSGRMLVRARNWVQSSPDAAMVLRARQEIEQELASLRTSLMEVQSVRDEVMGVARQLEDSVESFTSAARAELTDIGSIGRLKPGETAAGTAATDSLAPAAEPLAFDPTPTEVPATVPFDPQPVEELASAVASPNGAAAAPAAVIAPPAPPRAPEPLPVPDHITLEAIDMRLQAIMSDLFAMQQQLRKHKVLDEDWQPPSWGVQLPANAAPVAEAEEPSS